MGMANAGAFIGLYALFLGAPFALATLGRNWLISLLGPDWWLAPLALMAVLSTAGPFMYIFLQRRAEAIILREQHRYQDILKKATMGMTRIRNLEKLLKLIVYVVTKTVRISHCAVYLYDAHSEKFLLEASRNFKSSPAASIGKKNELIIWLEDQCRPIDYAEAKAIHKNLELHLRRLNASVVVPCFLEHGLIGLLILGEKLSGAAYTQEDLYIFSALANQAALALENALFILRSKMMQEQISQAEKMATIGTMADGLSHQINNRFHSLSMIAGDSLDSLNLADIKNYPKEARELFSQLKHALERIQANVMQGKEVVGGLLKYTRKAEAGLSAVSIDEIIDGALEMVKFKVNLSEIEVLRNYPPELSKVNVNLAQLEEVFFNLIDNSYDAISQRKQLLKEKDYSGRITISCSGQPQDNLLSVIFADNGIGLQEKERSKVFTPFFTTKTSSRRGTGLGLFVIQRIITQLHQGRISFESEYARGTRFILELPVANGK